MSRFMTVHQLKNDVRSLQSAVTELHSKLKPSPDVLSLPSWRYPERTATSIDLQIGTSGSNGDEHVILLELLVDRFLLILQSCVSEIDSNSGRSHCGVPLSISSTVKRFVRGFVQQEAKYSELEKTVEKLTKEMVSLKRALDVTQEQCSLYKEVVATNTSTCVINNIPLPKGETFTYRSSSCSLDLHVKTACTQTMETSLGTCLECPHRLKVFKSLVKQICTLSSELSRNIAEEASVDTNKLLESAQHNLSIIKDCTINAHKSNMTVKEELASKQSLVSQLEQQSSMLMRDISELQNKLKQKQLNHEEKLILDQEKHKLETIKLKDMLNSLLTQSSQLREDMTALKKTESELRLSLAQKNKKIHDLKLSNEKSCAEKKGLEEMHKKLNTEIAQMKEKYKKVCVKLEEKCLELTKTSTKLTNLENQCQSLKSKQKKLLEQVDDLDQKCSYLNVLLDESMAEKEDMKMKLLKMTETCKQELDQLKEEKQNLASSNKENEELKMKSAQIEQEILAVQQQLNRELQKTKLLMEYPFSSVVAPMNSTQSRNHINANTVRILLLEEQNDKLREKLTPPLDSKQTSLMIDEPIQLWQTIDVQRPRSQERSHSKFECTRLVPAVSCDAISESDSYTGLETHSCIDCDRLFCSAVDFHEHFKECNP